MTHEIVLPGAMTDEAIPAILRQNTNDHPIFQKLHWIQQENAQSAIIPLQRATGLGYLDTSRIRRILDFGAGVGGPTYVLTKMAEEIGADVEAVEQDIEAARRIIDAGILPEEKVYTEDGITFLDRTISEKDKYDLITACMLGPDFWAKLFRKLARVGGRALQEDGKLLIYSDSATMEAVRIACKAAEVHFDVIQGVDKDEVFVPTTIIIPKESLLAI